MKLKFVFAAFAASVLASCNEPVNVESLQAGELADLEISVDGMMTKADSGEGENTVNDIQVFVFGKESGLLEAYKSASAGSVNLSVFTGEKIIYALVNASPVSGIGDYGTFSKTVSYLNNNAAGDFEMEGVRVKNIATTKDTAVVRVNRVASKVTLQSVTNNLDANYKDLTFSVKGAYLINVLGEAKYVGEVEELDGKETWYNKRRDSSDNEDVISYFTSKMLETPVTVDKDSPYTDKHSFYCYPNPTAKTNDTSAEEWSVRCTRLVVEISLGEVDYYYPVTIPSMKQNTEYKVSLAVTRPGSVDPDVPYAKDAASVAVDVVDWYQTEVIEEII